MIQQGYNLNIWEQTFLEQMMYNTFPALKVNDIIPVHINSRNSADQSGSADFVVPKQDQVYYYGMLITDGTATARLHGNYIVANIGTPVLAFFDEITCESEILNSITAQFTGFKIIVDNVPSPATAPTPTVNVFNGGVSEVAFFVPLDGQLYLKAPLTGDAISLLWSGPIGNDNNGIHGGDEAIIPLPTDITYPSVLTVYGRKMASTGSGLPITVYHREPIDHLNLAINDFGWLHTNGAGGYDMIVQTTPETGYSLNVGSIVLYRNRLDPSAGTVPYTITAVSPTSWKITVTNADVAAAGGVPQLMGYYSTYTFADSTTWDSPAMYYDPS